jgi:hypothetical protein
LLEINFPGKKNSPQKEKNGGRRRISPQSTKSDFETTHPQKKRGKTLKHSKTPEFRRIKVSGILWLWNPGSLRKKKHDLSLSLSLSHTHTDTHNTL